MAFGIIQIMPQQHLGSNQRHRLQHGLGLPKAVRLVLDLHQRTSQGCIRYIIITVTNNAVIVTDHDTVRDMEADSRADVRPAQGAWPCGRRARRRCTGGCTAPPAPAHPPGPPGPGGAPGSCPAVSLPPAPRACKITSDIEHPSAVMNHDDVVHVPVALFLGDSVMVATLARYAITANTACPVLPAAQCMRLISISCRLKGLQGQPLWLRGAGSYLMCPAVAFRKLGRPQASCARLPRALCALMKRLNRPRDAKRSSSAVIESCRAVGFPPASVCGVAAPLLLLASSLPPVHDQVKRSQLMSIMLCSPLMLPPSLRASTASTTCIISGSRPAIFSCSGGLPLLQVV